MPLVGAIAAPHSHLQLFTRPVENADYIRKVQKGRDAMFVLKEQVERSGADTMLIIHDDLDLPLGEVRERDGGGHGGHNGLRDVIARLGTGGFRRLRIGIGRPPGSMDPADYVLATFRPAEGLVDGAWRGLSGARY